MTAEEPKNDEIKDVALTEKGDNASSDAEQKKLPYPKSVFFIISNEFCERFSYYGMRTILSLYLRDALLFSESDSTVIYHLFTMLAYFFPLIGAAISDSWLGRFKTILYVSMIYAAGNILLAVSSTEETGIPQVPFSLLALFIIAFGTGGIKPCVSSFGGDQFILPQQAKELVGFFSVYYFAINSGSLISTFITPIIREQECFGSNCYILAFAVPGALMVVSIVIFAIGSPMYIKRKPEGNVLTRVVKCITYALKNKKKNKEPVEHWLDTSVPKYGQTLVNDVKITLKLLVIFAPLPIFWSLYDQQGTQWTFQAARMDGVMGSWTMLPDQMQVVNPLLILGFIPLFNYVVYPLAAKCNLLTKPLERMIYGGFTAAIAFGISAGVAFALEATDPVLPSATDIQLRIYNPLECNITNFNVNYPNFEPISIAQGSNFVHHFGSLSESKELDYSFDALCAGGLNNGLLDFTKSNGMFYYFTNNGLVGYEDAIGKPEDGLPNVRTLIGNAQESVSITYTDKDGGKVETFASSNYTLFSFKPGTYYLNDQEVKFKLGGVYTVLAVLGADNLPKVLQNVETTNANSVHIMWLLPQNIVITCAEMLISITGIEFSYSQAPANMKSVLSAIFLLTSAFGNLLIVIIESVKIFDKQSYDFLLYTGLMVVDMIGFAFLARNFKPPKAQEKENEDDNTKETVMDEKENEDNNTKETVMDEKED